MYTYNKDDKSYTFSSDDLNIQDLIDTNNNSNDNTDNDINNDNINQKVDENDENISQEKPRNIEVIDGGNDLNISPVSEYIEIEKPKNDKKENIVIPEDKKYIYTIPSKENVLMDADYLLSAFDILKVTELNLKITGFKNPMLFENENGKGLILPIIKY